MKKNTLMRIASVLLVVVLATTCVISGTFAKYITSDTGTDSVRVAKWGFEATGNSIDLTNLFKTAYVNNEVGGYADIVAPGTTNSVTFKFEYDNSSNGVVKPEVAYNFTVEFELADGVDPEDYAALDANPNFTWILDTNSYQTFDALKAAVLALSGHASGSMDYAPQTLPTAFPDLTTTHTIGWNWAYQTVDNNETPANEMDVQDATDTAMGNADALANIGFVLTITATQLDTYTTPVQS